jgi:hypothetical protein
MEAQSLRYYEMKTGVLPRRPFQQRFHFLCELLVVEDRRRAVAQRAAEITERRAIFDANNSN